MHANYLRIEKALKYIVSNSHHQPSLDEVAEHVNLSPFHFQRLFVEWAGLSPKEFLSICTLNRAKQLLTDPATRIIEVSEQVGLSSSSRLHELFIKIEGVSPAEFRDKKFEGTMFYSVQDSPFGEYLVLSSSKGISYLAFLTDLEQELLKVRRLFPGVVLVNRQEHLHAALHNLLQGGSHNGSPLKLHLLGSAFRIRVWEALLRIPLGEVCTYAELANAIGSPGAARAVGNAVAANPVVFFIPCHRVILSSGVVGNYMWGPERKTLLLGWEAFKHRHL